MKRPIIITATLVTAIVAMLCLLSSCMSIGTPWAGEPVTIQLGEALVFGRIHMLDAQHEQIEYSAFRSDPWDQPFFGPGPRMTLELRKLYSPGGAFTYKTNPVPPIEENGSFYWILSAGDYELLGNPRLYGSERFDPGETGTLAFFRVPESGGTIYLGTLIISVDFDFGKVVQGWKHDEAEYTISGHRVVDERESELLRLRSRFPRVPEPVVCEQMRVK